jgi:hypothetical protein
MDPKKMGLRAGLIFSTGSL